MVCKNKFVFGISYAAVNDIRMKHKNTWNQKVNDRLPKSYNDAKLIA